MDAKAESATSKVKTSCSEGREEGEMLPNRKVGEGLTAEMVLETMPMWESGRLEQSGKWLDQEMRQARKTFHVLLIITK